MLQIIRFSQPLQQWGRKGELKKLTFMSQLDHWTLFRVVVSIFNLFNAHN